MLVLTRKVNEQILIGDEIKITLVRVRGNTVRIGIEAPRDVRVVRGELTMQDESGPETDASRQAAASEATEDSAKNVSSGKPLASHPRTSQFSASSRPSIDKNAARRLYMGSVTRDGKSAELTRVDERRAPLARFIAVQ